MSFDYYGRGASQNDSVNVDVRGYPGTAFPQTLTSSGPGGGITSRNRSRK